MERKRVAEAAKGVGRPKVGGPFTLVDQNGRTFTDEDMKGKYALVSALGGASLRSLGWDVVDG